ncbi:MAG: hypothetical protein RL153_853 [Verrucomicrobiota bacterium]
MNDGLGPRGAMAGARPARPGARRGCGGGQGTVVEEAGERDRAEAGAALPEEMASGHARERVFVHGTVVIHG